VRNKVLEYAFVIAIMINRECIILTGHNQVLLMYAYRKRERERERKLVGRLTSPACLAIVATCSGSFDPSSAERTTARIPCRCAWERREREPGLSEEHYTSLH